MTACKVLLDDIEREVSRSGGALFIVFVDFKSAFDTAPRDRAIQKLAAAGVPGQFLELLSDILRPNRVILDDGVQEHPEFEQTTGFPQGDVLSPLLFSIVVSDLPDAIQGRHKFVKALMYADDLALYSRSSFHLRQALVTLQNYVANSDLEINVRKTKAMKICRGGRIKAGELFRMGGQRIERVNSFPYLGVVFSTRGTSFAKHVAERARKATLATAGIRGLQGLSLDTALAIFDMKVAAAATYGVPLVWERLSVRELETLDRVKANFLKRALGLPKNCRNRLAYLMADTPLLTEEVARRYRLPRTPQMGEHLRNWEQKMSDVDADFFRTRVITDDRWKQSEWANRHYATRFGAHGFHHEICEVTGYHEAGAGCRCRLCGLSGILTYHLLDCPEACSLHCLGSGDQT